MGKLISWHFGKGIKTFLEIWKNYVDFFWWNFSVNLFLRTLFSPWRRDVSHVSRRGLHPVLFFQTLIENLMTRTVGAIVKLCLIIFAILVEIITLILGAFLFINWLLLPLIIITSIVVIISNTSAGLNLSLLLGVILFLIDLWLLVLSWKAAKEKDSDYYLTADLLALSQEDWFVRVWNRLGKSREEIDLAILTDQKRVEEFLTSLAITLEEFNFIVDWELGNYIQRKNKKKFWRRENLFSSLPMGKYWSYAYTVKLDKYTSDLSENDYSEYRDAELIGKEKDINELKLILSRPSQNNVILVGEPGVGRDTLIHTLAKNIRKNQVEEYFSFKRILELDLQRVFSDFSSSGEIEEVLGNLFIEAAYAGNVILIIKNIHEYISGQKYDISPQLSEFLELPTFQMIATTTPGEFHEFVEKKANIMKYSDKIIIEEMPEEETKRVIMYKLKSLEKERVLATYQAVREIVNLSGRYITDAPFPEKALDMLEEVILYWSNQGYATFIGKETVDEAVSMKIKIPLGEVEGGEAERLLNLENILHERIVGQDLAIDQIAQTIRRARIGMAQKNKPLGSFLFLGPTGVGKTESAKALAEAYFGSEERMIRLDMSEYQSPDSIDRILGSSQTGREGYLVSKVKENPQAILLIDEIEKAYRDILNLFLQILDEGHLTDAFGKKISFTNLIIIATSNAGSSFIQDSIQAGVPAETIQKEVVDYVIKENIFRPEFINRFEGVVFFHPLTPEEVFQVTKLLLDKYALRLKEQENIQISFGEAIARSVAQTAYDPVFGARAINRHIMDKIEDGITKKIISGEIKKGTAVEINDVEELG